MAKLSRAKFYQVCEKLKELKQFFDNEKPLMKKAAQVVSTKLGFEVSAVTLQEACQVAEVSWEIVPSSAARSGAGGRVIASMRHQLDLFNDRLNTMTDKIMSLEERLLQIENIATDPNTNGHVNGVYSRR